METDAAASRPTHDGLKLQRLVLGGEPKRDGDLRTKREHAFGLYEHAAEGDVVRARVHTHLLLRDTLKQIEERNAALEGLQAPDFTLPDIDGEEAEVEARTPSAASAANMCM